MHRFWPFFHRLKLERNIFAMAGKMLVIRPYMQIYTFRIVLNRFLIDPFALQDHRATARRRRVTKSSTRTAPVVTSTDQARKPAINIKTGANAGTRTRPSPPPRSTPMGEATQGTNTPGRARGATVQRAGRRLRLTKVNHREVPKILNGCENKKLLYKPLTPPGSTR